MELAFVFLVVGHASRVPIRSGGMTTLISDRTLALRLKDQPRYALDTEIMWQQREVRSVVRVARN